MWNSKTLIRLGSSISVIGIVLFTLACPAAKRSVQSETLASKHSVTLTWKASPGAQFYCVYRNTVQQVGISENWYQSHAELQRRARAQRRDILLRRDSDGQQGREQVFQRNKSGSSVSEERGMDVLSHRGGEYFVQPTFNGFP